MDLSAPRAVRAPGACAHRPKFTPGPTRIPRSSFPSPPAHPPVKQSRVDVRSRRRRSPRAAEHRLQILGRWKNFDYPPELIANTSALSGHEQCTWVDRAGWENRKKPQKVMFFIQAGVRPIAAFKSSENGRFTFQAVWRTTA